MRTPPIRSLAGKLFIAARLCRLVPVAFMWVSAEAANGGGAAPGASPWEQQARSALDEALAGARDFVRIHAGEAAIALGEGQATHRAFLPEAEAGDERYRLGVWRVLAASAPSPAEAAPWIERIRRVLDDPADARRWLALESLNKLGVKLPAGRLEEIGRAAGDLAANRVLVDWAQFLAGDAAALDRIAGALSSAERPARARGAYALRWLRADSADARQKLADAAQWEPAGSGARVFIVSAALVLAADPGAVTVWRRELERMLAGEGSDAIRYQAALGLGEAGAAGDLAEKGRLLLRAKGDARVGLAWALLDELKRPDERCR